MSRIKVAAAILGAVLILCSGTHALAQPAAPTAADYRASLGLRDAWQYLTRDVVFPGTWVEDTHDFTYRKSVEGGFVFLRENARTGKQGAAFDHEGIAKALDAALEGEPVTALRLPFTDFAYADKGEAIKFEVNYIPWKCALANISCVEVEEQERPSGFGVVRDLRVPAKNEPHLSPDEKWEALVIGYNLVVRPAGGRAATVVTTDGSEGAFYDPQSILWAPDSQTVAAYRVEPGFARYVTRVVSAPEDQLQPKVVEQLYPKPGDRVDREHPVLVRIASGKVLTVDPTLIPNAYKLDDLQWREDGDSFAFHYTRRGHQQASVIEVDAQTGAARAIITEEAPTFIYRDRRFWHLVEGADREAIWLSERDGRAHLYLYDTERGQVINQITTGGYVVREVVSVDDENRQIYFAASGMNPGEDPYFLHYYRIDFDGSNLTPLTQAPASHEVTFSSDRKYYLDTYSRVDLPNVAELRRTADGSLVRRLGEADVSRLMAAGFRPPEVFVAKARDGVTDIWGLIVKPRDFDPAKTYPVIENIYAGPHDSFVPKTFWPFGWFSGGDKVIGMQALADLGFIVVQMDGMGTANRTKAFQDVAWKNVGESGFPDRILWHQAAAKAYRWYDISRGVGLYGGSAGGQSTLGGLLFHPDFYTVGVAFAGCFDNRMDKISWNEQWMGWPVDESYAASSGVDNAWRLQGDLLIVYGEQDSNVDPASSLQVVNALIEAGKDFDLLTIPGGEHAAGRSTGPIDYGQRRTYDFFVRHLMGAPTPDWNANAAPSRPAQVAQARAE